MKGRWYLWMAIIFSCLFILWGCGKENGGGQNPQELIEQGWAKFTAGNYTGACADFNAAIGLDTSKHEAYLGLGWAELKRNNAGLAENAFNTYLAKASTSLDDAKAGLAIAYHAQKKFQDAIDMAEAVLSSSPSWSFSHHDSQINYLDLAYVLAESYCLIANYSQSLAVIKQYFDPSFDPDLDTYEGRSQLADKIESLYTG